MLPKEPRFWQVVYLLCRFVHFLLIAISLPLAYSYLLSQSMSRVPAWLLGPAWVGAAFWALFHFGLHNYAYPTNSRDAVLTTALPLLNLIASGTGNSFAAGAYSVLLASFLALALSLAAITLITLELGLRRRWMPQAESWFPGLTAGLLSVVLVLIRVFGGPLWNRFGGAGIVSLAGASFVAQVASEAHLIYRGSVFSGEIARDSERWRLHTAWAPVIIICMMGSLLVFGITALWHT